MKQERANRELKEILAISVFLIFTLSMLLLFAGFIAQAYYRTDLLLRLGWGGMGFVFLFVVFKIVWQFGCFAAVKLKKMISAIADSSNDGACEGDVPDFARRRFLANCMDIGITGVSFSMAGFGTLNRLHPPDIREVRVPVKNLPCDLEGFKIVQISDVHVGNMSIERGWVETVVHRANRQSPDIVALTGDLADDTVSNIRNDVAPLADLCARFGCYFVTGNHEYYPPAGGVAPWIDEVEKLGFTVLMNENRIIQRGDGRILLAGVPDYGGANGLFSFRNHVSDPAAAMAGSPPADVKILLAHQPRSIFGAEEAGFDLQLSGHTHGGQFFPGHFFVTLSQPYVAGLHTYRNTQIYVNSGVGHCIVPLRLGAMAEITSLILTKA